MARTFCRRRARSVRKSLAYSLSGAQPSHRWGEQAVADEQVVSGRRVIAVKRSRDSRRFEHQLPPAVGPCRLPLERDAAVAPQPQTLLREWRRQCLSARSLQPCAMVRRHPDVACRSKPSRCASARAMCGCRLALVAERPHPRPARERSGIRSWSDARTIPASTGTRPQPIRRPIASSAGFKPCRTSSHGTRWRIAASATATSGRAALASDENERVQAPRSTPRPARRRESRGSRSTRAARAPQHGDAAGLVTRHAASASTTRVPVEQHARVHPQHRAAPPMIPRHLVAQLSPVGEGGWWSDNRLSTYPVDSACVQRPQRIVVDLVTRRTASALGRSDGELEDPRRCWPSGDGGSPQDVLPAELTG